MNLLIASCGRRVFLIKKIREQLNKQGFKLYVTDQDKYAPALYFADDFFILDNKEFYITQLIEKCKELNITHILSLHDIQILELTKYQSRFDHVRIKLLLSTHDIIELCYDKVRYDELPINQIPTTIIKNQFGSASQGLQKVKQPFLDGKEYNVQCYFDFISGKLIDVFMQEKILMRGGETDRSISIWDDEIYEEIKKLDCNLGFRGAIDIDIIKSDKVYIIDINPRFGGGYPLADYCGMDYIFYLLNNANKLENKIDKIGQYKYGISMMKYNEIYFEE